MPWRVELNYYGGRAAVGVNGRHDHLADFGIKAKIGSTGSRASCTSIVHGAIRRTVPWRFKLKGHAHKLIAQLGFGAADSGVTKMGFI